MVKNISMLFHVIVLFLIFYACNNSVDSTDGKSEELAKYDLFPLEIGKSYFYLYDYRKIGRYDHILDSGYVKYDIINSSKYNDTLIVWTIKETRHFNHYDSSNPYKPPVSYMIDTSTVFSLFENLNNSHELQCKSLAWTFPFVDSIFTYPDWTNICHYTFYRYSSNVSYQITNKGKEGAIVLYDTLSFNESKGLTFYRRDYYIEVMSGYDEILKIKLVP